MLKFREECLNVAVSLRNSAVRRCSPARSGRPAVKRFARQPSALRLRCSDGVAAWCISAGNTYARCVPPVHSPGLSALSGPHYSIAAGEWSEPAEERQEACGPQGGPTSAAVLRCWACIELRRRFSLSVVRPLWGRRWWIHLSAGSLCSPAVIE